MSFIRKASIDVAYLGIYLHVPSYLLLVSFAFARMYLCAVCRYKYKYFLLQRNCRVATTSCCCCNLLLLMTARSNKKRGEKKRKRRNRLSLKTQTVLEEMYLVERRMQPFVYSTYTSLPSSKLHSTRACQGNHITTHSHNSSLSTSKTPCHSSTRISPNRQSIYCSSKSPSTPICYFSQLSPHVQVLDTSCRYT